MIAPKLTLYHMPGACSFVSRCALEEAGLPYEVELLNLRAGDQNKPDFLAISPLGKVPTLVIDGEPLTENAAIIVYIASLRPIAGLFPVSLDPRAIAEAQGGLSFCGGTLHPIVRGLINPARMTTGEVEGVRERAMELAVKSFAAAEQRLAERGWWLGAWSIVDVYLNWAFGLACVGGLDAFARVMALEAEARAALGL
jgi:glutathione S-transferase